MTRNATNKLMQQAKKSNRWNDFKVPETTTALFPFDGHTSQNVLERLKKELV